MSTATITPRMTVEEFLLRPEREDGLQEELIEGEVYLSPSAKPLHSFVTARAIKLLRSLEDHGFYVLGETAFRLSSYSLPNTDATVVRQAEFEEALDADQFPTRAPALAIEVHSPSNNRKAMLFKIGLYLEHGSEQCWVIYPKQRKVTIFYPDETNVEKRENDVLRFYDCTFPVSELFARSGSRP